MERMNFEFGPNDPKNTTYRISAIPEIFKRIEGSTDFGLVGNRDQYVATYHVGDATVVIGVSDGFLRQGTVHVASRDNRSLTSAVESLERVLGEEYTLTKTAREFD